MRSTSYQNFDLYIDALPDGGCRARVTASPRGQATDEFELPEAQNSGMGVRAWLAGSAGAMAAAQALFSPLLASAAGGLLLRCLDAVAETGMGLRVRLHLDPRSPLASLPWELLPHPAARPGTPTDKLRYLALNPLTPVIRYVDMAVAERPLLSSLPLRVLAVLAGPTGLAGLPPIDVEAEWAELCTALEPLEAQRLLELVRAPVASLNGLQARLSTREYDVLHFVGHGLMDARAGEGALVFCDQASEAQLVTAGQLAALVQGQRSLRLAYLSACHGAGAAGGDASASVAQHLVGAGLPAVIAMQDAVQMKAAQVLSRAFYAGLAGYLPVDAALGEARKAALLASEMAGTGSGCDWALPVLFSRSGDNALLSEPAPLARPQIERAPFEPETVLIPAGRFVMGRDAGDGVGVGESPQHTLELPAYRIGRTPVTNAQYAQFVHATRRAVTSETGWQLAVVGQVPPPGREQHPVVGVTWDDAVAYCRWLSEHSTKGDRSAHASSNDHDAAVSRRRYRLPSEAEWERAARGPGGRIYPWGDKFDAQRCNAEPAGLGKVSAVGTFSPDGDTPEGAVDMAGNVWEWTGTAWGRDVAAAEYMYPYRVDDGREDPQPADGPLREYRICRGGSFREQAERVTGSARSRHLADSRAGARGFRVVMEVE